jgi:hypothetical protein
MERFVLAVLDHFGSLQPTIIFKKDAKVNLNFTSQNWSLSVISYGRNDVEAVAQHLSCQAGLEFTLSTEHVLHWNRERMKQEGVNIFMFGSDPKAKVDYSLRFNMFSKSSVLFKKLGLPYYCESVNHAIQGKDDVVFFAGGNHSDLLKTLGPDFLLGGVTAVMDRKSKTDNLSLRLNTNLYHYEQTLRGFKLTEDYAVKAGPDGQLFSQHLFR